MNIAYYSHYFAPEIGAPSSRIYDLAKQWLAASHSVQVVTCFPNHPLGKLYPGYKSKFYQKENLEGIEVHRHWTYITPNKGLVKKTLGHISFLPSGILCRKRLSNPEVIIGTSPTFFAAMAAAHAGKRFRVPFIMEIRDLWPAIFVDLGVLRNPLLIHWLEKLELGLYRQAARVVTLTKAFKENLVARGVPADKIHTIPNGADTDFWQPIPPPADLRRELGLAGRFVILYIGAHGISHGLNRILESADLLRGKKDICFLLVGEGADKAALMQQAERMGLGNVIFHPSVPKEEVRRFYALADVCLVPLKNIKLFEGFIPSKMFEMMAMGRPIVGSVRGEAAEILKRSGAAIVVPPEDSRAIAEAVLHLYGRPAERENRGANGRAFVTEHYSRQTLAVAYLQVLEDAVADGTQ